MTTTNCTKCGKPIGLETDPDLDPETAAKLANIAPKVCDTCAGRPAPATPSKALKKRDSARLPYADD
jgi:hypothetical protein